MIWGASLPNLRTQAMSPAAPPSRTAAPGSVGPARSVTGQPTPWAGLQQHAQVVIRFLSRRLHSSLGSSGLISACWMRLWDVYSNVWDAS